MSTVVHLLGSQLVRKRHAGTQELTSVKMVFHFEITILWKSYIHIYFRTAGRKIKLKEDNAVLYHVADQLQMDYLTKESASNMNE